MHFFYLDESGDTGANLQDAQQPIFVLAGLSIADKKWNNTKTRLDQITLVAIFPLDSRYTQTNYYLQIAKAHFQVML